MAAAATTALPIGNVSDAPLRVGTQNHVHIFLNHYFLQMNANGTVDGSPTDGSNQTLWHRIARPDGTLLRSSSYCTYLCINECGYGYSALLPNGECLWSEVYDAFDNRFIVKQFENNRTAYLAINGAGKLKRVVLLKREKLMDLFEQTHVLVKNSKFDNFTDACHPLNTKKLSYMPPKTCKNPPRHKKKVVDDIAGATTTPRVEIVATSLPPSPVPMIPDSIIWEVFNMSVKNNNSVDVKNNNSVAVNNSTEKNTIKRGDVVINATIVNRMDGKPDISNEVIPMMGDEEVVYLDDRMTNKTKEGAIPKNFYYHDEEFSIRTLSTTKDETEVKSKSSVSNSKNIGEDVKESVERVISKLLAAGNSTSYNAVPLMFVHHTTSLKICLV
ncbi:fibroblast growth factor [Alphabaculovirus altersperidaniae]|uniref:Fibroblast growth factor n=1 Tax=Spodoptera eridania nucleopolyhedrovirus TaxID=2315721 RepID=A0ABX6TR64_9ABAC|nr:fibroblast growth factor [Spodoptera eridania nucleopolyhedrovirus]QNV47863.1 fibroblast growth factor [Spodoptera eridania nucleopolyhedrovirus]